MTPRHTLVVQRYVPGVHDAPTDRAYPLPDGLEGSLLDAMQHIKDHLDPTLAWRWSCRMGMCGSCGVMVNGEPVLACEVFLRDLKPGSVHVAPLAHLPIERDLIVDTSGFLDGLTEIRAWLVPAADRPEGPGGEGRQSPDEAADFHPLSQCINCMLCYAACPQVALTPGFLGPAAIALAHRYDLDSRDAGHAERAPALQDKLGVWACTVVGECSVVCPKSVDPAAAIQQQKVRGLLDWARAAVDPRRGGR